jgi:hypothetical protein
VTVRDSEVENMEENPKSTSRGDNARVSTWTMRQVDYFSLSVASSSSHSGEKIGGRVTGPCSNTVGH